MIKYFKTFFVIMISLSTFVNADSDVIFQEVQTDNVQPIDYNVPKLSAPLVVDDKISTVNKKIKTHKDIKIFTSNEVEPINYTNTISLNKLQVSEKKQKFFHMILPAILISKANLKLKRERVLQLSSTAKENYSEDDVQFLEEMYKTYKTKNHKKLAKRLKTHPVSIILAQAAIESAWGESRFFKKGNNIFGMWSYNRNEPRIKALGTRNGKAIYVKKYANISEAIDDYFAVIGRGAYKSFRKQRNITDNPLVLVDYLVNYCELDNYPSKLKKFIVYNKLRKFDKFELTSK